MTETTKAWLAKYKISSHTIAAAFALLTAAYFQVPAFHDLVTGIYGHFPQTVKELVATAVALFAWYRNTQKTNGGN